MHHVLTTRRISAAALIALLALAAMLIARPQPASAHKFHGISLESSAAFGLIDDSKGVFGSLTAPSPLALAQETAPAERSDGTGLASAGGRDNDFHTANFRRLSRAAFYKHDGVHRAQGSDLAFRGNLMVAGAYSGIGLFRLGEHGGVSQRSYYRCPGSQGDVTVMGEYVFVSIDSPGSNHRQSNVCNNTRTNRSHTSYKKEGIRIVDISDASRPRQVGFIETECGSHTQTLIPGRQTSHLYVQSYPLNQQDSCTEANHPEGEISIIEVPNNRPDRAELLGVRDILPPTVTPDTVGCHDIGVLPEKDIAAAACLGAFATLDISDPARPRTLGVVQNPLIELDHSAQLTWDGKIAVIGDEHAGAAGGGGCSDSQDSPVGAMWYYDITDPDNPALEGSYSLPRVPPVDNADEAERFRCTTHNYSVLPMRDRDRYIAVSPYYSGGLSVVDFTTPDQPKERGYYLPQVNDRNPDMWSGYWYDGQIYTNEHASKLGISSFRVQGLGDNDVRDLGGTHNPQTQVLR